MEITKEAQDLFLTVFDDQHDLVVYLSVDQVGNSIAYSIKYIRDKDIGKDDVVLQYGDVRVAMKTDDQPHFIATTIDYVEEPEGIVFRSEF